MTLWPVSGRTPLAPWPAVLSLLVLTHVVSAAPLTGTFTKVGHSSSTTKLQINGVGSGPLEPALIKNWVFDDRFPLISPVQNGTCPENIYNANAVNNGLSCWNIFFGGWDGVSSCHDSISVVVTEDNFTSFHPHFPQIATGAEVHVNNPSGLKVNETCWLLMYTQLQPDTSLNKPGLSRGTSGIDWFPSTGGDPAGWVKMANDSAWAVADVNGGNVIYFDNATDVLHMYFIDFKREGQHSVFHATATAPASSMCNTQTVPQFELRNIALDEPMRVVNDVKLVNGYLLMGLHMNGPEVYYTIADAGPDGTFPPSSTLFVHLGDADKYIVSLGWVVDATGNRLLGALYGAGAVSALDENKVFAAWLQRRVLFVGTDSTVWGLGPAARSLGPDVVTLDTNAPELQGRFFVYDSDYVDADHRGTLVAVSDVVTVAAGDIWEYSP
mmetsp:Transcript_3636/g.8583  ORF Transcript_3636/g.8583 Transcript_3636/m.8583 type:complete len:440 (-) Transcript_3636:56-1375(-)